MSQLDCRVYERVCALLFDEWDPIGVAGLGGPRDEYDAYAGDLMRLVLAGANEDEVSHRLADLARVNMGLSHVDEVRDRAVARRLIALVKGEPGRA